MEYDPAIAAAIIRRVRLGDTLREACADEDQLLAVYDWLRDKNCKLDGVLLSNAYARACEDQRLSWQDMAKSAVDNLELHGDRADTQRISEANARGRFYLALAKESRIQTQVVVGEGDRDVTVTIKKYHDPAPTPDPASDDE